MPPFKIPKVGDYEEEAIQALVKAELIRGPGIEGERVVDALIGIGFAVLATKDSSAVAEMRAHAAETDHILTLRLIDTDVFGVHCGAEHCHFHTEWRT